MEVSRIVHMYSGILKNYGIDIAMIYVYIKLFSSWLIVMDINIFMAWCEGRVASFVKKTLFLQERRWNVS